MEEKEAARPNLPPPCGGSAFRARTREEGRAGGEVFPIVCRIEFSATSRPLPPPGSPLRYRARGSPTSPQGGGRFGGRALDLYSRAICGCRARGRNLGGALGLRP